MSFAQDVHEGLRATPKYLSSKYFYDTQGDKIFQSIMGMPSYYLTRCEYEIFDTQKSKILDALGRQPFNLIEFGAGDGFKTKVLLRHFLDRRVSFNYMPIDISEHILEKLKNSLLDEMPGLSVKTMANEYFDALKNLKSGTDVRKVLFFLGSNIGNFLEKEARSFLTTIHSLLNEGDMLLLGLDLKKDPRVILSAYNDPQGITSAFNLNLLKRINIELNADFNLDQFYHFPSYDPVSGIARSYLISGCGQKVTIAATGESYSFLHSEPVFTEMSQKYDLAQIKTWERDIGFKPVGTFFDTCHYFANVLWEK